MSSVMILPLVMIAGLAAADDPGLATLQASALWRMSPGTRNGAPVLDVVTVRVNWKLAPAAPAKP